MSLGNTTIGSLTLGSGTGGAPSGTIRVQVGGYALDAWLDNTDYQTSMRLNSRSSMNLSLHVSGAAFTFAVGQWVRMLIDTTPIFSGTIEDIEQTTINEKATTQYVYRLSAVSDAAICDRRVVTEVYENQSVGAIVRSLLALYLASENITAGVIEDSITLVKVVFAYRTVSECLDELCKKSGLQWMIDENRQLHVYGETLFVAPFALTSANAVFRKVVTRVTRDQYRNVQIVRAGRLLTAAQTESAKGDGQNKTFHARFPLAQVPTITVNGVAKTVGIRSVETGKDFYWSKDDRALTQDDSGSALTSSDTITWTYRGLAPLTVVLESPSGIADRQAFEGGTGRYERVEMQQSVDGSDVVTELAAGLIRRYSTFDTTVELETDEDGLRVGQSVLVTVPELGLSGYYLVRTVRMQGFAVNRRRYQIGLTSGEERNDARQFFAMLAASGQGLLIRDNEVIERPVVQNDPVGIADTISATTSTNLVGVTDVDSVGFCQVGV